MAQMTKEQLYNYLLSQGMLQAGRNPGTLSVDLGDNTGYITQFTTPEGFRESQIADVANPAGFNAPFVTPADFMAQIADMTYVPDWQQALKEANNGGFLADYGWMLPLGIAAGGAMLGGLGGAGATEGLYGLELGGEGVGAALGGTEAAGTGGLSWLGNEGLATIPEAVGSTSGGMLDVYYPGAVIDNAIGANAYNAGTVLDAATAAAASGGGAAASLIPGFTNAQLVSGGLSLVGGLLSGSAGKDAAQTSANAQLEAARIAADAAKFRPVGVTTRFGQSNFTKDAQGNVTGAGYTLSPELKAMQDSLLGAAPGMLSQFTGSQATTAPMGTAAQRAMSLGNQYLATDPLAQAQKYYNDQQAVMATQRARDEAGMLTGEFNRGTYGLATGATGQMGAANPRLEALYNAQRQQDLQLAAAATQGGMDYAKFGAGMVGTGGDLLKGMYGTQTASYAPFQTALGGAQTIEGLGQNALDLSINMGKVSSPAQSGQLLSQGMLGAAQTMQPANSYSPLGALLTGGGNALQGWQNQAAQQQQQLQQTQMLANALRGNKSSFSDGSYGGTWY